MILMNLIIYFRELLKLMSCGNAKSRCRGFLLIFTISSAFCLLFRLLGVRNILDENKICLNFSSSRLENAFRRENLMMIQRVQFFFLFYQANDENT
jgi:hypothetical protein